MLNFIGIKDIKYNETKEVLMSLKNIKSNYIEIFIFECH